MAVRYFLREVILDIHTGDALSSDDVWLVESVDATTIMSVIEQIHGLPKDIAWTSTDRHERIEIGWTYEAPEGRENPGRDVELIVIPMFRDMNTRKEVSVFEYLADQRTMFEDLAAEGHPVSIVKVAHEEWVPGDE